MLRALDPTGPGEIRFLVDRESFGEPGRIVEIREQQLRAAEYVLTERPDAARAVEVKDVRQLVRDDQLRPVIRAFGRLAAEHRGETTAEVVTARPLNDDQLTQLRQQLRTRAGRDVNVDTTVDPTILGGIVVKLGSQMIDASIRTKLNRLAVAMKG